MAYVEYDYGAYKPEIRKLLRKRLTTKERVRYHRHKIESLEESLKDTEKELDEMLQKAKRTI